MTAAPSIDPAQLLHDQLAQASPDLLRELLTTFVNALLSAEADAVCGPPHRARRRVRTTSRTGYRPRTRGSRAGSPDRARPTPRAGPRSPAWLREPAGRAEAAMSS